MAALCSGAAVSTPLRRTGRVSRLLRGRASVLGPAHGSDALFVCSDLSALCLPVSVPAMLLFRTRCRAKARHSGRIMSTRPTLGQVAAAVYEDTPPPPILYSVTTKPSTSSWFTSQRWDGRICWVGFTGGWGEALCRHLMPESVRAQSGENPLN